MPDIKVESPEYLVTAADIVSYIKEEFNPLNNKEIYDIYCKNPVEIIEDFVQYIYFARALPTEDNINELTKEIKEYLHEGIGIHTSCA